MAKQIRAIRETTTTFYAADGSVENTTYAVKYLKQDADDTTLRAWVGVDTPTRDEKAAGEAQRDAIEAAARITEGINPRG